MIEVEALTVRFAGVTPIDDMSVVFQAGTCGLIGPNGAGKTTFFNVLSGFVNPARGAIRGFGGFGGFEDFGGGGGPPAPLAFFSDFSCRRRWTLITIRSSSQAMSARTGW